jgi:hypothetical protein
VALADRDLVMDALCVHFANGDLTMNELERRLELAVRATSGNELQTLVADLHPLPEDTFDSGAAPPIVPSSTVPPRGMLIAVLGASERAGGWIVPRHTKVFFAAGGVGLDLRNAKFGPGVSEIEVSGIAGAAEIIVPPGVRVEPVGTAFMGAFAANAGEPGPPLEGQPVLRVSGFVIWGSVEVLLKAPKTKTLRRFDKAVRASRRLTAGTPPARE